jgi:hypothetical protein
VGIPGRGQVERYRPERLGWLICRNVGLVSRGEAPIPNLVNTYDNLVQAGLANDADPAIPAGVTGGAIWSGFASPLGAMLGWEYYDGPGGSNLDCTTPSSPGCWGTVTTFSIRI